MSSADSESMPRPKIIILGAGLSGLALANRLQQISKKLGVILYDKSPAPTTTARHSYGLSLDTARTWPLLKRWGVMDDVLVSAGAPAQIQQAAAYMIDHGKETSRIRVNRAKLEDLLSRGVEIQWDHKVSKVAIRSGKKGLHVKFENGSSIDADVVVAAEGIHSVIRKTLLSNDKPTVLPWVVFRGRRQISAEEWRSFADHMAANELEACFITAEKQRLEVKVDDWQDTTVSISYTYSREARAEGQDPLHKPDRELGDAKVIPEELFRELSAMRAVPKSFKTIFEAEKVREDRLLHWLMRIQQAPNDAKLRELAESGILFAGEAAQAKPILGGYGAESAIANSCVLAEYLAMVEDPDFLSSQRISFMKSAGSESTIEASHQTLRTMHDPSMSNSSEKL